MLGISRLLKLISVVLFALVAAAGLADSASSKEALSAYLSSQDDLGFICYIDHGPNGDEGVSSTMDPFCDALTPTQPVIICGEHGCYCNDAMGCTRLEEGCSGTDYCFTCPNGDEPSACQCTPC